MIKKYVSPGVHTIEWDTDYWFPSLKVSRRILKIKNIFNLNDDFPMTHTMTHTLYSYRNSPIRKTFTIKVG